MTETGVVVVVVVVMMICGVGKDSANKGERWGCGSNDDVSERVKTVQDMA